MTESCVNRTRVTVVLSTRDRAGVIPHAVCTILENHHPDFEVVIVDQSDDRLTEASLNGLLSDGRVRYLRSATRGRSAGLNAGIREAHGALVLLTDDDCSVPDDWIRRFEAAFAVDERIGIVFGNVLPGGPGPRHGLHSGVRPRWAVSRARHSRQASRGGIRRVHGSAAQRLAIAQRLR